MEKDHKYVYRGRLTAADFNFAVYSISDCWWPFAAAK